MYVSNNQILGVYYTTDYSNLEDNIAFNSPPPPPLPPSSSFLPLNIKKLRVITEAMMIID